MRRVQAAASKQDFISPPSAELTANPCGCRLIYQSHYGFFLKCESAWRGACLFGSLCLVLHILLLAFCILIIIGGNKPLPRHVHSTADIWCQYIQRGHLSSPFVHTPPLPPNSTFLIPPILSSWAVRTFAVYSLEYVCPFCLVN